MSVAFIFPGQGSQFPGMGHELAESFVAARAVFEETDETLGRAFCREVLWAETGEALNQTENTQPALLAVSLAALRVLEAHTGKPAARLASFAAGHSLGEYAAWTAAGMISFADALRLVETRGRAMAEAVGPSEGAMAAILGLEWEKVEAAVDAAAAETGAVCVCANDNDPRQVVISGHKAAVEAAVRIAREAGARRALILPVSVPSHSPLMAPAAVRLEGVLEGISVQAPQLPVIPNVLAAASSDVAVLKEALLRQLTDHVRWRQSVFYLESQGVASVVELGAGKVLCGLVKRTAPKIAVYNCGHPADFKAIEALW